MDLNLLKKISDNNIDIKNFVIGENTFFKKIDGESFVEIISKNNSKIIHKLDLIKNLYSGDNSFDYESKDWDDKYMPILLCVETAICGYYIHNPDLNDKTVINILERLILNPDIKIPNDLINSLQNNLKFCLCLNNYSRHEIKGSLKRIPKSAKRHHKIDGRTGYSDFLEGFFNSQK